MHIITFLHNSFFGKIFAQYPQIIKVWNHCIGRFSGFRFEDLLEIRLYEPKNYMSWKLYESKNYISRKILCVEKLYELKLYELKLYELELYESKLYEMLLSLPIYDTFSLNIFLLTVVLCSSKHRIDLFIKLSHKIRHLKKTLH